jgi:hypothetical protein
VAAVYVFDAKLEPWAFEFEGPVTRRLALPAAQTLVALHDLIQQAFGWADDHLYSFWLDGEFWGDEQTEYTRPEELEEDQEGADVPLDELDLRQGQKIAYVFDFGDEWRVALKLAEIRDGGETGVVARNGEAPPQYPDDDEDDEG